MSKNKTRTKDKYRVVYNDTQRIELENEFRLNEYIAIPRKQEIAQRLQLSERQIKIWFQNRRAKKRKQLKRKQSAVSTTTSNSNTTANSSPTSTSTIISMSATTTTSSPSSNSTMMSAAAVAAAAVATGQHQHHHHLHLQPNHQQIQQHQQQHQQQQLNNAAASYYHHHHHHHAYHQSQGRLSTSPPTLATAKGLPGETTLKRESISSADSSSSSSVYQQHQDLAYNRNGSTTTTATTTINSNTITNNLQAQSHQLNGNNHTQHAHLNNHDQHSIYANSYYNQTMAPGAQQIHHSPYSFDQAYHEYHANSDQISGPAGGVVPATNPWQHTQSHDPCTSPIIHNVAYATTNGYHQGLPNSHHNHHRHLMLEQSYATANPGQTAALGGVDPISYH